LNCITASFKFIVFVLLLHLLVGFSLKFENRLRTDFA